MADVRHDKRRVDRSWIHYVAALKASQVLASAGFEAYVIGGAVRDIVLNQLPKDFDLVTNATPDQINKIKDFARSIYKDTAQAYGVTRVKIDLTVGKRPYSSEIEIATYRRDIEAHLGRKATKVEFTHLEDDLQRRDFTINALALDLLNDYLVDLVGGLSDIDARLVRFIGEAASRIQEDPLRILRGIRLKNQLEFDYEPSTAAALQAAIAEGQIQKIATDRLRQELTRILVDRNRLNALADLDSLGVTGVLLPEVLAGKGVAQPPQFHSEGDVYEHTLLAMAVLGPKPTPELAWATLLHDVAKPVTAQKRDRIRFNDHYEVGAAMARDILKRLNFSKKAIDHISWMVRHHLSIDELPNMRPGRQRQMLGHPAFAELLELHKADAKAALGKNRGTIDTSAPDFSTIEKLWEQYQLEANTQDLSLKTELGIDGNWLKQEYQLEGEKLGAVLDRLNEAYLDGNISDEKSARRLVEQQLKH